MGNESSVSESSSNDDHSGEETDQNPIVSKNDTDSMLSIAYDAKAQIYGCKKGFTMLLFIQHFERSYAVHIPSTVAYLCCLYFVMPEIDHFDDCNQGVRCALNQTQTKCTLSGHVGAANTVYGAFTIDHNAHPTVIAYKWRFRIIHKKQAMFIGIDSNPIFKHTDFSNCFRDFKFTNFAKKRDENERDRFCAYSSDGYIFHYHSQVAHSFGASWNAGDEVTMVVDALNDSLNYYVNGASQGVAMDGLLLANKTYHIAVALFDEGDSVELFDFSAHCTDK